MTTEEQQTKQQPSWFRRYFIYVATLAILVMIFGVYALPLIPKQWAIPADKETMANQIANMSFLLTFLSTLGAIGGIGFTIFGYFQSTRIPELIDKEVKEINKKLRENNDRLERQIRELKRENDDRLEKEIRDLKREIKRMEMLYKHRDHLSYATHTKDEDFLKVIREDRFEEYLKPIERGYVSGFMGFDIIDDKIYLGLAEALYQETSRLIKNYPSKKATFLSQYNKKLEIIIDKYKWRDYGNPHVYIDPINDYYKDDIEGRDTYKKLVSYRHRFSNDNETESKSPQST